MYKTCLLLSGLPRSVEASYQNIQKNIIYPNDPDIFIHTWIDPDDPLAAKIIDLYKPKGIIMEKLRSWNNSHINMDRMMNSYAKAYERKYFVDALYSAWFSIQQSNLLKEQYRLENDIVYDCAIRARLDINYNMPVQCCGYDQDKINVSNRGLPEDMVEDLFGFGPNHLMNIYCSAFNLIDHIHTIRDKKDGVFCGEVLLFETLKAFNVSNNVVQNLACTRINA